MICTECLRQVLTGNANPCRHRLYQPTRFAPFRLSFTGPERIALSRELPRWEALHFGERTPNGPLEVHFAQATAGKVKANSPIESAFLKLLLVQQLTKRLSRPDPAPKEESKLEGLLQRSAEESAKQQNSERSPKKPIAMDRSRPAERNAGIPEHEEGVPKGDWYSREDYYRMHPDRKPRRR